MNVSQSSFPFRRAHGPNHLRNLDLPLVDPDSTGKPCTNKRRRRRWRNPRARRFGEMCRSRSSRERRHREYHCLRAEAPRSFAVLACPTSPRTGHASVARWLEGSHIRHSVRRKVRVGDNQALIYLGLTIPGSVSSIDDSHRLCERETTGRMALRRCGSGRTRAKGRINMVKENCGDYRSSCLQGTIEEAQLTSFQLMGALAVSGWTVNATSRSSGRATRKARDDGIDRLAGAGLGRPGTGSFPRRKDLKTRPRSNPTHSSLNRCQSRVHGPVTLKLRVWAL